MKKLTSLVLAIKLLINSCIFLFIVNTPAYALTSATKYAATAHDAYEDRDFIKSAQNYEKAYQLEKNTIFLDNAITSYLNYAFDMSNEKKYDEGIKYCLKVLELKTNEQNAKELLSDIYYTRGSDYFFAGEAKKAGEDYNNSLKFSVLPEQSQRANEALSNLKNSNGKTSKIKMEPIVSAANNIPDLIKLIEMKVYGKSGDKMPLIQRIQKLETDVFNQNYSNESLSARTDRLKKALMPELIVNNKDISNNDNYIMELISQNGVNAKIFGQVPIYVYIDNSYVKIYKRYFDDAVKSAMKDWEAASDSKIKFQTVGDPMRAHIKVVWADYFEDFAWQPKLNKEDLAAKKQQVRYGKASSVVQIGSIAAMVLGGLTGIPVIGMVGSVGGSVASPILQYKSLSVDDRGLTVKINTQCTAGLSKEQATAKIKQISLHQFGHAIGIYGHSPNPDDIMYENFSVNNISDRDKRTINEIYKNIK